MADKTTPPSKSFYWSHHHIISLLDILIALKAYSILDSTTTANSALYMKVVEQLKEYNGIEITETQARNKFKNLKREFRHNKNKADKSGAGAITWPYYDKFIELEGNRPSSRTNDLGGETAFEEPQSEDSQRTQDSENNEERPESHGSAESQSTYRGRKRRLPDRERTSVQDELLQVSKDMVNEIRQSRESMVDLLKAFINRPAPPAPSHPPYFHPSYPPPPSSYPSQMSFLSTPPAPSSYPMQMMNYPQNYSTPTSAPTHSNLTDLSNQPSHQPTTPSTSTSTSTLNNYMLSSHLHDPPASP